MFKPYAFGGNFEDIFGHLSKPDDRFSLNKAYNEIPEMLPSTANKYHNSTPIWVARGLQLPALLMDQSLKAFHSNDQSLKTDLIKNKPPVIYELAVRRAFGYCDDERASCDKGCDHDVRNRMFCYRTCVFDDRKCDSPQWDSCQFEASYQGEWELIKPRQKASYEQKANTALQLTIAEKHIHIRSLEGPDQQEVSFQCVRKASETIGDWFVIRSVNQMNGW
ncbi:hypothetical protein PHET_03428 [Paragonimus heterotremus]|uniref:Uncharacterized protein n=1 Tax=Paragonimus heterotremus TaxID=100268 RepID=A0A8J4T2X7_9TREM|nr:hypothetical protein PHET_03428 [Paragonimus heterotremus]